MTTNGTIARILLPLVLLGARPVLAQDPRLTQDFTPQIASRLQLTIDSAQREGLPTEPLLLRALEGHAKGASTDLIVAALGRLHAALLTARTTLGPAAPELDLTTAAAALQAGVPQARLAELHQLRAGMPLTAPLGAYLDLIARGASPDRTWSRIADLARRRAGDAEFGRLTPADVDRGAAPVRAPRPPAGEEP